MTVIDPERVESVARELTKAQRRFVEAVAYGHGGMFGKGVTSPVEAAGWVSWVGSWRRVGCNSFPAVCFVLTDAGRVLLRTYPANEESSRG